MQFTPTPLCPTCGSDMGWPTSYHHTTGIAFDCSKNHLESTSSIPLQTLPITACHAFFTYANRSDQHLLRRGETTRWDDFIDDVQEELATRGLAVQAQPLTHTLTASEEFIEQYDSRFAGLRVASESVLNEDVCQSVLFAEEAAVLAEWESVCISPLENSPVGPS